MVEHRLLSSSLITLLFYLVAGKIKLPILTTTAGLIWLSISFFYYTWLKKTNVSIAWIFPISCILVSFAPYQVIVWPMAAMQHLSVIFMGYLTIYLLTIQDFQGKKNLTLSFFLLATFIAITATFSAGNGMLAWPTGILILVLKKEFKFLLIWICCSIFATAGNFWNSTLNGTPSDNSIKTFCTNFFKEIISFLAGLGGGIRFQGHESFLDDCNFQFSLKYPPIYLGLFIFISFIYLFVKTLKFKNNIFLPIVGTSVFIFLTVALLVIGRTPPNGDLVVFKSRYYIYSIAAIINTIFILAAISKSSKWHQWFLLVTTLFSIGFWGIWEVLSSHKLINHSNTLQVGQFNWRENDQWVIYQSTAYFENYFNSFFNEVKNKAFGFELPQTILNKAFQEKKWNETHFSPLKKIHISTDVGYKRLVRLNMVNDQVKPIRHLDEGYVVIMASQKDTFLLWSLVSPTGLRNFLKTGDRCSKGYRVEVELDPEKIPKGIYFFHQFYYSSEDAIARKKPDGKIVFK
ncbi:hypothetical protein [Larkinella sp. C7]|uniref:hypothetical protein n=1 Tax=Larkinella sp. C7 TaxID=2576607 RepID=UPI0011114E86|nr:hypothetical protein [Larkinella sp. C7]